MYRVLLKNLTERAGMVVLFTLKRILQGVMEEVRTEGNVVVVRATVGVVVGIIVESVRDHGHQEQNGGQKHHLSLGLNHHPNTINHPPHPDLKSSPNQNLDLSQDPNQSRDLQDIHAVEVQVKTETVGATAQAVNQHHQERGAPVPIEG